MALFLLRYAEMGLKSEKVRSRFQHALIGNIENHFIKLDTECLVSWDRGRIYVMTDRPHVAREVLSHTFGIVSYSEAIETKNSIESILDGVIRFGSSRVSGGITFAVRARRSGQQPYTSIELARRAGEAILDSYGNLGLKVDLERPGLEIFIDAREKGAYIYATVEPGPGGLPLGTQGTVLCPLYAEKDILSAWMMMRRGCRVIAATDNSELASPLRRWDSGLRVLPGCEPDGLHNLAAKHACRGIARSLDYSDIASTPAGRRDIALFYPLTGLTETERKRLLAKVL